MATDFPPSRACKSCSQLKVRCYPSSTDQHTCERCQHAGRECVPAGKRRRPRDRIAELEAQVAGLTKALQRQQLFSPQYSAEDNASYRNGTTPTSSTGEHKDTPSDTGSKAICFLDSHVSVANQQQALDVYMQNHFLLLPAFPLLDSNLLRLRKEAPILLFSIAAFATSYLNSQKVQDELMQEAMRIFGLELISKPSRRLEIVWAVLIASYWFRAQSGISHVTIHQLVQLATGMAIDLGIGGSQNPITPGAGDSKTCHPGSLGAERVWLACFVGTVSLSIGIRRHDPHAQWTAHHEGCLIKLGQSRNTQQTDRLFLHIVRGQKLCHQIATSLSFCDTNCLWDLTTDESQLIILRLKKDIDDWTAEIPLEVDHKPLLICRYSAIMYLNEPVLHTATNKLTFGAPFRYEKLAECDFPTPIVTGKHVAALYALRDSCHAMLDLATESATVAFLATCPLPYVAKVFHGLFILAKLYLSVTAPGNTYGTVLRPSELRMEQYLSRMDSLTTSVEDLNQGSYNARILACHLHISTWFKDYVSNINRPVVGTAEHLLDGRNSIGAQVRSHRQVGPEEEADWLDLGSQETWLNDFILDDLSYPPSDINP